MPKKRWQDVEQNFLVLIWDSCVDCSGLRFVITNYFLPCRLMDGSAEMHRCLGFAGVMQPRKMEGTRAWSSPLKTCHKIKREKIEAC